MNNTKTISLKILNKDYQVICPEGLEEQLQEAAEHLDLKMREIKNLGRIIGIERISIMAALNIAHELFSYRRQKESYVTSVKEQIDRLQNKIDEALISTQSLEDS